MRDDIALMLSFVAALAATLLLACIRSLFGDQAANCATLVALCAAFYRALVKIHKKPRPGRRLRKNIRNDTRKR